MATTLVLKEIDYAEHQYCNVNGNRYCYLEAGTGPTILLVHGYPDNAYSWEHQIRFFSEQGYRVIAPFMRGYLPTETQTGSYFDRATLVNDMVALIHVLNDGQPVYLVGQDWGAAIGYGLLGAFPEKVLRSVLLAVPHPVEIKRTLRTSPKHIIRSFHWFLFQLPVLPEWLIRLSNGRFLEFLWRIWSPDFADQQHVSHMVAGMLQKQGVEDTLAYYRAATQSRFRDASLKDIFDKLDNPITVPTKVLCGMQDMRREMLPRQTDLFTQSAQFCWDLIDNAGHFLHREQPALVNRKIEQWLRLA